MFSKKKRHSIAFLCAVMLMWSQFAVAAYACPQMLASPALNAVEEAGMPPDCAREMENKPTPLCKAHCDQSAQSDQVPAIGILPFTCLGFWVVSYFDTADLPSSRSLPASPAWLADASPPLRIQYQVFRI